MFSITPVNWRFWNCRLIWWPAYFRADLLGIQPLSAFHSIRRFRGLKYPFFSRFIISPCLQEKRVHSTLISRLETMTRSSIFWWIDKIKLNILLLHFNLRFVWNLVENINSKIINTGCTFDKYIYFNRRFLRSQETLFSFTIFLDSDQIDITLSS